MKPLLTTVVLLIGIAPAPATLADEPELQLDSARADEPDSDWEEFKKWRDRRDRQKPGLAFTVGTAIGGGTSWFAFDGESFDASTFLSLPTLELGLQPLEWFSIRLMANVGDMISISAADGSAYVDLDFGANFFLGNHRHFQGAASVGGVIARQQLIIVDDIGEPVEETGG